MTRQAIRVEQAGPANAEAVASLIGDLLEEIMNVVGAKVFSYDVDRSALESRLQSRRLIDLGRYTSRSWHANPGIGSSAS